MTEVRYYTDSTGAVVEARLPGVDDWVEPAATGDSATFSAAQVEQLTVDAEIYRSLPVAEEPTDREPYRGPRPNTGR
jgi:hypothetical protein